MRIRSRRRAPARARLAAGRNAVDRELLWTAQVAPNHRPRPAPRCTLPAPSFAPGTLPDRAELWARPGLLPCREESIPRPTCRQEFNHDEANETRGLRRRLRQHAAPAFAWSVAAAATAQSLPGGAGRPASGPGEL